MIADVSGVYAITHAATGHVYVGSSKHVAARWRLHRSRLAAGRHHAKKLLDLWQSDGPAAFTFSMLEECGVEDLALREQAWMDSLMDVGLLNSSMISRACPTLDPVIAARGGRARVGRVVSPETRDKIRQAILAAYARGAYPRCASDETKRRMSDSHKRAYAEGRMPREHSQECRAKISASVAAFYRDRPEKRAEIASMTRAAWKRQPQQERARRTRIALCVRWAKERKPLTIPPEKRLKMSAARRGHPLTPEHRAKISAALRGRQKSVEHLEHLRLRMNEPEVREKRRAAARGKGHDAAWRAKVSAAKMGHTVSEEARKKMSAASLARWADPDFRARASAALRAGWASKPASRARMSEATHAYWQRMGPEAAQERARHAARAHWTKERAS